MTAAKRAEKSESTPPRKMVSDEVADRLQERILDGTFRPGDRLPPERDLADQLGVNRSSVREALKKLEQLRLVEIQQGSGIRVREFSDASFELVMRLLFREGRPDLSWIRDLLEVRRVFLLGLAPLSFERATEDEISRLAELVERAASPDTPDEEFPRLFIQIQDTHARMTHNQVVVLLWNNLRRFALQAPFEASLHRLARERRDLIPPLRRTANALRARDLDSGLRASRELLQRFDKVALDVVNELSHRYSREPTR